MIKLDDWQKAILYLSDINVDKITVEYSGGGDSGAIDNILFYDKGEEVSYSIEDDVREQIKDLCYPMLDGIEDWYNNEGGYGHIDIDLKSFVFSIENNIYIRDKEQYIHGGSIKDFLEK